jgi:hypothetical protein
MGSINRAAIVIQPKPTFLAWAQTLEGAIARDDETWTSVYLVNANECDAPEKVLQESYALIFEEQLASWHRIQSDWPAPRSFELFQQWFHAEVVDLVFDLAEQQVGHDD